VGAGRRQAPYSSRQPPHPPTYVYSYTFDVQGEHCADAIRNTAYHITAPATSGSCIFGIVEQNEQGGRASTLNFNLLHVPRCTSSTAPAVAYAKVVVYPTPNRNTT